MRYSSGVVAGVLAITVLAAPARAQEKTRFSSLEEALRSGAALAGGSGVGGECGAVASGYLVLGLRHGSTTPAFGDVDKEKELFGRIARFVAEFKERYGAITCRGLLGVDVFTQEGREEALRKDLFTTRCPNYIRGAITMVDSLG